MSIQVFRPMRRRYEARITPANTWCFRWIYLLPIALVFMTSLCGCSRQDKGVVTIRYMAWGNASHLKVEQRIIDEFEKENPRIKVKLFMVPDSVYHQKQQIMLASRTAPDVMKVELHYFPALVRKGYFRPIDDFYKNDPTFDINDYFEQPIDECSYNGKLYGLNIAFGGQILYYNKTLFREAGIPDPYEQYKAGHWTWKEYLEAAKKLTKKDRNGKYVQFGSLMPHHWTVIWSFGGDLLTPDFKRCVLDSPESIRALQFMKDLRWKYHVVPTPAEGALSAFTFESGRIGMYFGWSGQTPVILENSKGAFEWDIAPVPAGPAGRFTPLKGNVMAIYVESKHPREAYEFIKFVTSAKSEMFICGRLRRWITTHKSVYNDPEYLKAYTPPYHTDVFRDEMKYGRRPPINERFIQWTTELNRGLSRMWTNELDAKEAVEFMVPRINRALQEEDW